MSVSDSDLDGGRVALQTPDGAAALVEGRLCLRVRWHSLEAHADP